MTKINNVEFACPHCGRHDLKQSMTHIVAYYSIREVRVGEDGDCDFEYDEAGTAYDNDGGGHVTFFCSSCDMEFRRRDFAEMAAGLSSAEDDEEEDDPDDSEVE